jgi:hypothetical protein
MKDALAKYHERSAQIRLSVLTAILIAFAAGFVVLQLSARHGVTVRNFDAQTF